MTNALTAEQNLKLYLFANGITVDPEAEEVWRDEFKGPMSLNEYASTSGLCLKIEDGKDGVWANAPYIHEFAQASQARLAHDAGFVIQHAGIEYPVEVVPVPAYHQQSYTDGDKQYPYTNLGVTHTDRVRVSPIEGCAWRCDFCNLPYEFKYRKKPMEELLRVIGVATEDVQAPARHVLISGGTPRKSDEGWIDEVYEYLADQSPLPVDVMMPARDNIAYPAWLGSVGVNMLSVNLEISDEERARQITPVKAKMLGKRYYLDYIERAVNDLGVGNVQSLIVFGSSVEPIESTLEGVQDLVDRGCIPVLSPFRPDPNTPMEREEPATQEEMEIVYETAMKICSDSNSGVKPGPRCNACSHNTVSFHDGSDFYIGKEDAITRPLNAAAA